MEFDKKGFVKIETLTPEEAIDFDKEFLLEELGRHIWEEQKAYGKALFSPLIALVWESEARFHRKDIENIKERRIKLRELFEL